MSRQRRATLLCLVFFLLPQLLNIINGFKKVVLAL